MAGADHTSSGGSGTLGTWRTTTTALCLVAFGFGVRLGLNPFLQDDFPFVTFFLATVYSAWRWRWQMSVFVMLLGLFLADWFFIPPLYTLKFSNPANWFGAASYLIACAAVVTLGEKLRRQNLRLHTELNERKQAEEDLRRMAQFPEQNPSPVMRLSVEGNLLYGNPASRWLLQHWKTGADRPVPEHIRSWVKEVLNSNCVGERDQEIDGRTFTFVAAPFPQLGFVNLYGRDVTERKAAERSQASTLERFHLLSDVSGRLLASEDPQKIINELCSKVMAHLHCDVFLNYLIDANSGQLRLNAYGGLSDRDANGLEWLEFGASLCGLAAQQQCRVIVNDLGNSPDPRATLMKTLSLQSYACHPLINAGRIVGTLSFASKSRTQFTSDELDLMKRISDQVAIALERIQTARALRESEFRFRMMANASPAMIWIVDTERRCVWLNHAWLEFVGRTLESEQGQEWARDIHPDDLPRSAETFKKAFGSRATFEMEYRLRRHDGEYRWILDRGTPMCDPNGEFKGYIGSCVDVHDRHVQRENLERAVRERTAQLQESVAELESFSYSIAHDMRAPLRAMHGFGKILMQEASGQLGEDHREYLRRIIVSAQRLDALIQDVLNYSRIARSDLPLEKIELQPFVRDILVSYPDFAQGKARIELDEGLPAVMANRAALTQVISNLLGNAVKFVSEGTFPEVRIFAHSSDAQVRLSFRDNGIGIETGAQDRIFQMFQRLHRTERYEGTGIGLAIVRKAMERMGGTVTVDSENGKGSTFHITLKSAIQA